jgi:hypothetical protein
MNAYWLLTGPQNNAVYRIQIRHNTYTYDYVSASFPLKRRAPTSASLAEEKTADMMEECTWMAPLLLGGGVVAAGRGALSGGVSLLLWKKMPPARDHAFFLLR